jgi:hypothetical protein
MGEGGKEEGECREVGSSRERVQMDNKIRAGERDVSCRRSRGEQ